MTQKEYKEEVRNKAKNLVKQYINFTSAWSAANKPDENPCAQYDGEGMKIGRAIQCAKISVQEICEFSIIEKC